jgi:hypothetical protein
MKRSPHGGAPHRGRTVKGRRRVTQERIDEMAELRRQGSTFGEIGARLGCSERTARRYVGKVRPQLYLPQADPEANPRTLCEQLASRFLDLLHRDPQLRSLTFTWRRVDDETQVAEYGGPPSILFLSEAERLIRERLEGLGVLALRLLALDKRSQHRFLREVVGCLYRDYVQWTEFVQSFGDTGEDWRPPRERPPAEETDEDDMDPF